MGQLPKFAGDDWKPAVAAHVRTQMHPQLRASQNEPGDADSSSPKTGSETALDARPRARSAALSGPALRLAASKSRNMTPSELEPHVSAMLQAYGTVSQARIKRDLHVSTDKAAEALRLAKQKRTVVPLSTRGASS
jgi:hypothetical protein